MFHPLIVGAIFLVSPVLSHIAPYNPGMWCINGSTSAVNEDSDDPVNPLYQLTKTDWWMHHVNGCDSKPPRTGQFLTLPAGGSFNVEMATNQAFTSFSYGGSRVSDWPDGGHYPNNYSSKYLNGSCITEPNLHTHNQSEVAGSAFAISYTSNLSAVTAKNLVVFSIAPKTPWKRIATFQVPKALPACPVGGCICVWGWVPNHCGVPNMYMIPSRCKVTNSSSKAKLATPKAPVWCENASDKCVQGAKQMVFFNQKDGNNVHLSGWQADGQEKSPGYNLKMGFKSGAQNDIFVQATT